MNLPPVERPMNNPIDDPVDLASGQAPAPKTEIGKGTKDLEVEVKFLVADLDAVRARLLAVAELMAPRVFERNVRLDTAGQSLLERGQLLRLRQDTRVRLTFKGPAAEDVASEAKVREEIELEVGDFDRMETILGRLGFRPVQSYEKYRETFHWGEVEVVLDELPFGDFVELEGSEKSIKAAAAALGLDWSQRVLANYLALMELARLTFDLSFNDLTFANFESRPVDMGELLPVCVLLDVEEP